MLTCNINMFLTYVVIYFECYKGKEKEDLEWVRRYLINRHTKYWNINN